MMDTSKCESYVFLDVSYRLQPDFTEKLLKRKTVSKEVDNQVILRGVCGALRPGRLTFILGPSGAGKTSLLKILAKRKQSGVSGQLDGVERDAVLVAQHATLIDTLTARETLSFAASLKLPRCTEKERLLAIDNVSKQLGIQDALDTRAGLMSGGERKRLTIACELLTDPPVMLLDEPTSGLDSVSSMSVIRTLKALALGGRIVACVVHQPSSRLYSSADDIILLADGRTVYCGTVAEAPENFKKAGFVCPQYYNMADFILEVATGEHDGNILMLESEAKGYAFHMKKTNKALEPIVNGNEALSDMEAASLLRGSAAPAGRYAAGGARQLRALLWRACRGSARDCYLTQTRIACHLVVALMLGALYRGAGEEASRVLTNTSSLFFFIMFLFFSNAMPTVQTFPAEATVVLQEHLNRWYSIPAYCVSRLIADIPVQLLCATLFLGPAWLLTSQPLEWRRAGLAWLLCALVTVLAQTFGLVVGAACDVKLALFVVPASNIPMLMFSEFFIPYKEMPYYLRPFATISYFRNAFDGFIQIVYGFDRAVLPCHEIYCPFKYPKRYIEHLGLSLSFQSDIFALVTWIIFLQLMFVAVLTFKVYRACR